MSWFIGDWPLS